MYLSQVSNGLSQALEFYDCLCSSISNDEQLWLNGYLSSGLYPLPSLYDGQETQLSLYETTGKLLAKAIIDSRKVGFD
jgi:hypothetical protein